MSPFGFDPLCLATSSPGGSALVSAGMFGFAVFGKVENVLGFSGVTQSLGSIKFAVDGIRGADCQVNVGWLTGDVIGRVGIEEKSLRSWRCLYFRLNERDVVGKIM